MEDNNQYYYNNNSSKTNHFFSQKNSSHSLGFIKKENINHVNQNNLNSNSNVKKIRK